MLLVYDHLRHLKQKKNTTRSLVSSLIKTKTVYEVVQKGTVIMSLKGNSLTMILFCILITRINTLYVS